MKTAHLSPDAGLPTIRELDAQEADSRLRERAEVEVLEPADDRVWEWLEQDETIVTLISNILGAVSPQGISMSVSQLQAAWARYNEPRILKTMEDMKEAV